MAMMQSFVAQLVYLLKRWLCNRQSGIVMQKNWALSLDRSLLQALQFSVHFNDLLSLLLRCNGFTGIQPEGWDGEGGRRGERDGEHM